MFLRAAIIFTLLFFINSVFALVFSITPRGPLPTSVFSGDSVTAYYTIENNTGEQRNNNYIKYLPPNVVQVTSGPYGNMCAQRFNLAPNGSSGDSCTLRLRISGAVNADDPNPRDHLFACFYGGLSCAGTNYPLNVTDNANNLASIHIEETTTAKKSIHKHLDVSSFTFHRYAQQHFTAIGTYDDGSQQDITVDVTWDSSNTSAATVTSGESGGLVTGGASTGLTDLTATLDGVTSSPLALTFKDFAYVVDNSDASIYSCPVSNSTGAVEACTQGYTSSTGAIPVVLVNPNGNYLYFITYQNTSSTLNSCELNTSGSISACSQQGLAFIVSGLDSVSSLSAAIYSSTQIYLTYSGLSSGSDAAVFYNNCFYNGTGFSCSGVTQPLSFLLSGLAVNPAETNYVYLTKPTETVYYDNTFPGGSSTTTAVGVSTPGAVIIDPSGDYGYIASGSSIYSCAVSGGALNSCATTGSGFTAPFAFGINPAASYLYVTDSSTNTIFKCSITSGSLVSCVNNTATGIAQPRAIAVL